MSEKNSIKIKSSHISILAVTLLLVSLITANAKILIENLIRSEEVDEELILEAVPRLNKRQLQEAYEIVKDYQKTNLTSNFPSDTFDSEATLSGVKRVISLNIRNASGVNGAAAQLAQAAQEKGYEIYEISTAPSLQNTTTVIYKSSVASEVQAVEDLLKEQGWPVGNISSNQQEQPYDIIIILGR